MQNMLKSKWMSTHKASDIPVYCESDNHTCIFLNITEAEQNLIRRHRPAHFCQRYRERILHLQHHPMLPVLTSCWGPIFGPKTKLKILRAASDCIEFQTEDGEEGAAFFCNEQTKWGDYVYEALINGESIGKYIELFKELRRIE